MSELLKVNGMVLSAAPFGDYDKRVVLLTRERGRITAFARGARRQNSVLLAAANPFALGVFSVYEGRSAYTLVNAEISSYFTEVKEDFEAACYGCYFMEAAEYYSRENLDGTALLNLLYVTLRVLARKQQDNELIRCVFEMRAMILNGEYPYGTAEDPLLQEGTRRAVSYVLQTPLQKLYSFTVTKEVFAELRSVQDRLNRQHIDREFKSLAILKSMERMETGLLRK